MVKNTEGLNTTDPDIVILSGQTCGEVKDLLKKTNDPIKGRLDNLECKTTQELGKAYNTFKNVLYNVNPPTVAYPSLENVDVDKEPILTFENESTNCKWQLPRDRSRLEDDADFRVLAGLEEVPCKPLEEPKKSRLGEFDQFHIWRKTAGLINEDEDWLTGSLKESQQLMDYITIRINSDFPKLTVAWGQNSWNPRLSLNGIPTQISLEKLTISYKGLLSITDDLNAQAIIANIVLKNLKELFL